MWGLGPLLLYVPGKGPPHKEFSGWDPNQGIFEAFLYVDVLFSLLTWTSQSFPSLPQKLPGDFPGTSLTVDFIRRESSGGVEWLGVWNCNFSGSEFSNLVARAIRNAVRANRFARIIRNRNPYFYSASGRFARITGISDSRESLDSRELCESIRANHATKFSNFGV